MVVPRSSACHSSSRSPPAPIDNARILLLLSYTVSGAEKAVVPDSGATGTKGAKASEGIRLKAVVGGSGRGRLSAHASRDIRRHTETAFFFGGREGISRAC